MNQSSAPMETLANEYLAAKHRDNAGRGCPLAALGSEIARQGSVARHTVTEELKPFISYLSEIVQGRSASLRRERAIALYASLVGAVVIARVVDDLEFSNEALHAVANAIHGRRTKRNTPESRIPARSVKKKIVSRTLRGTKE